jgi:hypothetical protein
MAGITPTHLDEHLHHRGEDDLLRESAGELRFVHSLHVAEWLIVGGAAVLFALVLALLLVL